MHILLTYSPHLPTINIDSNIMERMLSLRKYLKLIVFDAVCILAGLFFLFIENETFLGVCLILVAACFTVAALLNKKEKENLEDLYTKLETTISNIDNFKSTNQIRTENSVLSIDENSQKVVIVGVDHAKSVMTYVYNFSDIIESEIIQDEVTLTKTSRASQVGGALVGGALAGGVGAVIGGLSGSTQSKAFVKRMSLKIVFDNLNDPFQTIDFFLSDKPVSANDQKFANAMYDINQWHSIMSIIINRNNKSVDVRAN